MVLLYYGFTSSKKVYAYLAVALVQAGFRAVMPDADLQSARDNDNDALQFARFWQILQRNIDELLQLENKLHAAGLVDGDRFGVAGASLGGMTAMARYPHLRSVACLVGSGYFMPLSRSLFPPLRVSLPEEQAQLRHCWRLTIPATGWRSLRTGCCCGTGKRTRDGALRGNRAAGGSAGVPGASSRLT